MSELKETSQDSELEQVVNDLAKWDASDVGNPPSAAEDATLRELKAELDTLASELREPPPVDEFEDESDCRRAVELVEKIGREPTLSTQKVLEEAQGEDSDLGQIGPYQILGKVGEGGMGTVYKALHTKLDKIVALKVLPTNKLKDVHAVARFEREMKAVGKLEHPNIVRATDAGESDGKHFLVMEYVDRFDLSAIVRSTGPLPVADACEVIRQSAIGLQHAHEHGLVHRDLKPSNLMLAASGQVKVLDMGLALLEEHRLAEQRDLTTTGQLMGTLDYMAPEQGADSHEVDIRADIYSLGATLFKLLCGETPFSGHKYKAPLQVMLAIASEPAPSIVDRRDDVPAELADIVDRMLQKNPDERYRAPDEVAAALVSFCHGCDLAGLLRKVEAEHDVAGGDSPPEATAVHLTSPSAETQETEKCAGIVPQSTPVATASVQPSAWRRWRVLLGVVFGFSAILAASWVVRMATDRGTVTITSYDPEIEIAIRRNESVVDEFRVKQRSESTSYYSGHIEIEIKGGTPDDVEIKNQQFTLKRGDDVLVEIVRTGGAALASNASRSTREAPPLAKAPFDAEQAKTHQQAWARHLGVEVEITNSIGMKFRLIPPGEFVMGSPRDENEELAVSEARGLQHRVRLTRPFYLAVYEVTQEEYQQVMGENTSHFSSEGEGKDIVAGQSTDRHPADTVWWQNAIDFCKKLSARENRRSCYAIQGGRYTRIAGNGYRLPTEAEWEYACRAGSTGNYSFIDESELDNYAWHNANSAKMTHPVGQKLANNFGLHDNVSEWCQDWYQDWYGVESPAEPVTEISVDPLGPADGSQPVYRGGNCQTWAHNTWSARRDDGSLGGTALTLGFRVVSVLEDQVPGANVEPTTDGAKP